MQLVGLHTEIYLPFHNAPIACVYHPTVSIYHISYIIFLYCFSTTGNILAIACSYMYEQEQIDPMPEDCIFIRRVTDQETKPK